MPSASTYCGGHSGSALACNTMQSSLCHSDIYIRNRKGEAKARAEAKLAAVQKSTVVQSYSGSGTVVGA